MAAALALPSWLRELARIRRVPVPVGHTVRAALTVGGPAAVGAATDHLLIGVTISLATILRTIGEREASHRINARALLIATPVAACGYLFAAVQDLPLAPLVALMAVVAFASGMISVHGGGWSLGAMQLLLVTSIAIGLPDAGVVEDIAWFLLGAALYAALMAVDHLLVEPHRPEQVARRDLDRALSVLEQADADHRAAARRDVDAALLAAQQVPPPDWRATPEGIARWGAFVEVVAAADTLAAFVAAPAGADAIAARRAAYAAACRAAEDGRAPALEPRAAPTPPPTPWQHRLLADRAARAQAGRLALCFALAVSARGWIGLDHWYWVPATVGLVVKPEFGSVFSRAVLRVVGTAIGAALAAVALAATDSEVVLALLAGLMAAAVPWGKLANYALQTVAISGVILLLIELVAPSDGGVALPVQRVVASLAGGVIALVFGYLLWPSARRVAIAPAIATATAALADELRTAATPVPIDEPAHAERKAVVVAARRRAADALASTRVPLARAAAEPPPASTDAAAWRDAVAALGRLGDAISDHAVDRLAGAEPLAEVEALADEVAALRDEHHPARLAAAAESLAHRIADPAT